jgi:hypothetical protein
VFNGVRRWNQVTSTLTNAEGEFRFAELVAGKYTLATSFQIDGLPEATTAVAYVPVVYPAASGSEEAALTLTAGDHIEANLNPAMEKLYEVHGRIENPPEQGVNVEVETGSGNRIDPVFRFNTATGEFLLLLPNGAYSLKVRGYGAPPLQLLGTREISISGAGLNGVSIRLSPLATIPVEVEHQIARVSSDSKPAPMPGYWNVSLEATGPDEPPRPFVAAPPQGGALGAPLTIRDLEPGNYRLQVNTVAPWYVASASCGGIDLTHEFFSVAGSAAGCTMQVVLRDDSASLHWSLGTNNESELEPIFIYAIPLENLTQAVANADQPEKAGAREGSIEGLAPGRYLVLAFDRDQQLAYKEADALQKYSSLGKEVTLTAGSTSEVQLDLVNEQVVSGEQ